MAGQTALIVVDMLNTYEHEDAELLTESVAEAVGPMSELLSRATDQNARHTIFYMTPFEYLLGQRGVERLVPVGQVAEQCILYSALDAYVRHIPVTVPTDAVAHIHKPLADSAFEMMRRNMDAELVRSEEVRWTRS